MIPQANQTFKTQDQDEENRSTRRLPRLSPEKVEFTKKKAASAMRGSKQVMLNKSVALQ